MELRAATPHDIPAIVSLLRLGLGEDLLPKSEAYWQWKHYANPFGVSPVLLAYDGELLVGVRAFMRWTWTDGTIDVNAVRAVDTVTHPAYQGKGIFGKLTRALLSECTDKGMDLVYNTPNKSSRPGYLKMGWEVAGRMPVHCAFRPIAMARSLFAPVTNQGLEPMPLSVLEMKGCAELLGGGNGFRTKYSIEYLRWRYAQVPVANYGACQVERMEHVDAFAFYRIKPTRLGREFRVTDCFVRTEEAGTILGKVIVRRARDLSASMVTSSGLRESPTSSGILVRGLNLGPLVTVRKLNLDVADFKGFSRWSPSLGDMELF